MNIIFIAQALPFIPAHDGFRLYGANLIRCLSKRHTIDLISLAQPDEREHLRWAERYCHTIAIAGLHRPQLTERVKNIASTYAAGKPLLFRREIDWLVRAVMKHRNAQVLHVEGGWAGGLIPDDLAAVRILSLHDSWTLRCLEMRNSSRNWRERIRYGLLSLVDPRYERLIYSRFDRCVVVAHRDAKALRTVVPDSKVSVIPNGIDTEYFHPVRKASQAVRLVFHGNLSYAPNIACAVEFARDIFPKILAKSPQAEFHIIGAQPDAQIRDLTGMPQVFLSADLPDLREAVGSGTVYVCPMRYGSGVKNKLLEAMALGVPVVCYPNAMRGIECMPDKHFLEAKDVESFAACVLALIASPLRAKALAEAARAFVSENYSWESRARAFEQLYSEALEARRMAALPHSSENPHDSLYAKAS